MVVIAATTNSAAVAHPESMIQSVDFGDESAASRRFIYGARLEITFRTKRRRRKNKPSAPASRFRDQAAHAPVG